MESTFFLGNAQDEKNVYNDFDSNPLNPANSLSLEQPERSRYSRDFDIKILEGNCSSFLQFAMSRTISLLRHPIDSLISTNLTQLSINSSSRLLSPEKFGVLVR